MGRFLKMRHAAVHTIVFTCFTLGLGGCETVNRTYANVKDRLNSIDMPAFQPSTADKFAASAPARQESADGEVPCPPVSIIEELRTTHQFLDEASPRHENSVSIISIAGVKARCRANENNIIIDLDISFEGELGPRAREWNMDRPSFAYPYFLAITTADAAIVAKEVFAATVSNGRGQSHVFHDEHLRQLIPARGELQDKGREILIGFQLTDAELAYNRALMSGVAAQPVQPVMKEQAVYVPPAPAPAKKAVKPPLPPKAPAEKTAAAPEPEPPPAEPVMDEPVMDEPIMDEPVTEDTQATPIPEFIPPVPQQPVPEIPEEEIPEEIHDEESMDETMPAFPTGVE